MKLSHIVVVVLLSFVTVLLTVHYMIPQNPASSAQPVKETAFQRVMRTKILRCGYILWPPYLVKDTATGKLSGFTYDVANALAENTGITIDWAQEAVIGQEVETIDSGRADAICGAQAPVNPMQATRIDHSFPYSYVPAYAYVRSDDDHYQKIEDVNAVATKIAVIDGDLSAVLARNFFPKAQTHGLPNSADPKQMSFDVVQHKADIAILDEPSFLNFIKANPGSLKRIPAVKPLAYYPVVISVRKDDGQLREFVDNSLQYVQNSGQLDAILDRHQTDAVGILRVGVPYRNARE